jgi:hypothetical protein
MRAYRAQQRDRRPRDYGTWKPGEFDWERQKEAPGAKPFGKWNPGPVRPVPRRRGSPATTAPTAPPDGARRQPATHDVVADDVVPMDGDRKGGEVGCMSRHEGHRDYGAERESRCP